MHSLRWLRIAGVAPLLVSFAVAAARGQEPAPAPPPPPAEQQPPPANPQPPEESSSKTKHSHANDFLIRGTVFTPNAYAFPNVHLRIRRAGEKKFHWETYTNSRGEFAVRVPQGLQYEVVIVAKGFADESRTVDAKSGISEDSIVFQMKPAGGKK
jgi:hypothetical protein